MTFFRWTPGLDLVVRGEADCVEGLAPSRAVPLLMMVDKRDLMLELWLIGEGYWVSGTARSSGILRRDGEDLAAV